MAIGGDTSGTEGQAVSVSSDVTDPGADDTFSYLWTVTKGIQTIASDTTQDFSFTPGTGGTYTVALMATDNGGLHTSASKTITVDDVAPTASIVGNPHSSAEGSQISLTSHVVDPGLGLGDTVAYAWTVTHGGQTVDTGTAADFDFTPRDNGAYTVGLTVTDADGQHGIASNQAITVTNIAPSSVTVSGASTAAEGASVTLTSAVTDAGADETFTYDWEVTNANGDTLASSDAQDYTFGMGRTGSYTVSLTATDDGGLSTTSSPHVITVTNVAPVAGINAPGEADQGQAISLAATVSDPGKDIGDAFTYAWTITKDASTITTNTSDSFDFNPTANGTYVATLTVTDRDHASNTTTKTITVNNLPPSVTVHAPAHTNEGTPVSLTSTASDPGGINDPLGYAWTITDSHGATLTTSTSDHLSFAATTNGTFTAHLSVTDSYNATTSDSSTFTVDNVAPTVSVSVASTANQGDALTATSSVSDPGGVNDTLGYAWTVTRGSSQDFSGSGHSLNFTPVHPGTYTVDLAVTDSDGAIVHDTKTLTVSNVNPTVAIAGNPGTANEGDHIALEQQRYRSGRRAGVYVFVEHLERLERGGHERNQNYTFTPAHFGSYTVDLAVTDADSGTTNATHQIITVGNLAPTGVAINGAPSTGNEGSAIAMTGSASDPGTGDTLGYLWTVTKAGQSVATSTAHDFTFTPGTGGTFTVDFTATDDGGLHTSATSKVITVTNDLPVASITGPTSSTEAAALSYTAGVTDAGSGFGDTFTYAWSVTDKNGSSVTSGTNNTVGFTPTSTGHYTVSLTVTDADNATSSTTKIVNVANVAPTVAINGSNNGPEGTTIGLTSTVSDPGGVNDALTYAWNVTRNGDEYDSGTGQNFNLTPNLPGTYSVALAVTDSDGATTTANKTITVNNVAPAAHIGGLTSVNEGTAYTLSLNAVKPGSDTIGWVVDWGDGSSTTTASGFATHVNHTYEDHGTFNITATATDSAEASGSATKALIVNNLAPTSAAITGNPNTANQGDLVSFGSNVTDPGTANTFTYGWTVTRAGQQITTGNASQFSFTPGVSGTYTIAMTATDNGGLSRAATPVTLTVADVAPTVSIGAAPASSPEGTAINLTGSATDPGVGIGDHLAYSWSVTKNGQAFSTGTSQDFSFTPDGQGAYSVTFTSTDDDAMSNTAHAAITVTNVPPVISLSGAGSINQGANYAITFGSTAVVPGAHVVTGWHVNWGDGLSSDLAGNASGASHSYTAVGDHTVTATATDATGTYSNHQTVTVNNVNPTVAIAGNPGTASEGSNIALTSSVSDPGGAQAFIYAWSISDGTSVIATSANQNYTFNPTHFGSYTASLTVTDADGGVTAAQNQVIAVTNVAPNTPTITGSSTGTEGTQISLTGAATDPGTTNTLTYAWTLSTGGQQISTGTGTSFNFTPIDNGSYTVGLTVSDDGSLSSSASKIITVANVAPVPTITGNATMNEGATQTLGSSVVDPGTHDTFTYAWNITKGASNFGSGTGSSIAFSPTHSGTYTASLTVTDNDGDSNSTTKVITVANLAPNTPIITGATTGSEGTAISLTGNATDPGTSNTITYGWVLTKGSTQLSTGTGTSFNFTPATSGSYTATLTATDDGGLTKTASQVIAVSNVAPITTITGGNSVNEGSTLPLGSTVTDPGSPFGDAFTYAWTVTNGNTSVATGTGASLDFTPTHGGTYTATFTATDSDGDSGTSTRVITVGNLAPGTPIITGPTTGNEGTQISLTGAATDPGTTNILTYAWTLSTGGQQISTGTGTSFNFTPVDNGSYTVGLTATDDGSLSSSTSSVITVANVAPAPTITGNATMNEGATQTLGSSVVDPGTHDTFTYAWSITKGASNFGSGTGSSIAFSPTHSGTYTASLTVTDSDHDSNTTTKVITVANLAPTSVTITGAPVSPAEGNSISLGSQVVDPGTSNTFTYAWTATRGARTVATSTNSSFNFTADDSGAYTVTLTATDDGGLTRSATPLVLDIANASPAVTINGAPATGHEGTAISMTSGVTDAGSADHFTYAWSVTNASGPVVSSTLQNFSFTPDHSGVYTVSLGVTDDGGATTNAATKVITIDNLAPTSATITGACQRQRRCDADLYRQRTDPGAGNTFTYAWTATNGTDTLHGTGQSYDFKPNGTGDYTLSMTATDDGGLSANATNKIVHIANTAPTASIVVGNTTTEGQSLSLTGHAVDPGPGDTFTYAWTITHNGHQFTTGTGQNFAFTPTDSGSYGVDLTILDSNGAPGQISTTVNVANVAPSSVAINQAPSSSPEGTALHLTSSVTDAGTTDAFTYAWSVSNGGDPILTGTDATFDFTPTTHGSYTVTLIATDSAGAAGPTATKTINVTNLAPTSVTINGASPSGTEGAPISLTSTVADPGSTDQIAYNWTVTRSGATVDSGTAADFTFTPRDNGAYTVALTATDDGGLSTSATSKVINIANSAPDSVAINLPDSPTEGSPVDLTSTVTDPGADNTFTYAWTVTNGNTPVTTGTDASLSFTPTLHGQYTATLVATDDGGASTSSGPVTIDVGNLAPSSVTITGLPNSPREGTAIHLGSTVTDPASADTFTYAWSVLKDGSAYDTGTSTTGQNFSFTPVDNGSYVVSLAVTDSGGATTSADDQTIAVANVAPTGNITAPTGTVAGYPASFSIAISDPGTQDTQRVSWDFGDGVTIALHSSTDDGALTPTHTYAAPGTYVVHAVLRDKDGGSTTSTRQVTVGKVGLVTDPSNSDKTELVVQGTSGADNIQLIAGATAGSVKVFIGGVSQGTFTPTGHLLVNGNAGNDTISIASGIKTPAIVLGGAGNDTITDGGGNAVLVGGAGADTITAGPGGQKVIIGGRGADTLKGGAFSDLMISGPTSFDADPVALDQILSEWKRTDASFSTKITHLTNGTGLNGSTSKLNNATVSDDAAKDIITGGGGIDWFFSRTGSGTIDTITDKATGEVVTNVSNVPSITSPHGKPPHKPAHKPHKPAHKPAHKPVHAPAPKPTTPAPIPVAAPEYPTNIG